MSVEYQPAEIQPATTDSEKPATPAERRRWRFASHELLLGEQAILTRELRKLGATNETMSEYVVENMGLVCVLLARRADRSIPLSAWETIQSSDIDHIRKPELRDPEDPTPAA